jgi:hypothetical protein
LRLDHSSWSIAPIIVAESRLWLAWGVATAAAVCGAALLLTFMSPAHRKTFWAPITCREHNFLWLWERRTYARKGGGQDEIRSMLVLDHSDYLPPPDKIRAWLAEGYPRWLVSKPAWFTIKWQATVHDRLLPLLPEEFTTNDEGERAMLRLKRLVSAPSLGVDTEAVKKTIDAVSTSAKASTGDLTHAGAMLEDARTRQAAAREGSAVSFVFMHARDILECTDAVLPRTCTSLWRCFWIVTGWEALRRPCVRSLASQ